MGTQVPGLLLLVLKVTGKVRADVAAAALQRYRQRVRQLTRRQTGRSLYEIAKDLQAFMPGWKAYFRLAQTPSTLRGLDKWLRHRLRAIQLKFWGRGTTAFRELRALGPLWTWRRKSPA